MGICCSSGDRRRISRHLVSFSPTTVDQEIAKRRRLVRKGGQSAVVQSMDLAEASLRSRPPLSHRKDFHSFPSGVPSLAACERTIDIAVARTSRGNQVTK